MLMPIKARIYISATIAAGLVLLAGCLVYARDFADLPRYLGYLSLACIGSTLKIKLPKIRGTMSISFLFILLGVAELTLVETVTLGCIAGLMQCLWRPKKRPTLVQAAFNMATLVTSIAGCFLVSHALAPGDNLSVLLAVAVSVYFLLNTGMVSLVISLTEGQALTKVWQQCYLWSFPYYLAGSVLAAAIAISSRTIGWRPPMLMLPLMYLIYSYYRLYLSQQTDKETVAA
jgi:hypothetical protein